MILYACAVWRIEAAKSRRRQLFNERLQPNNERSTSQIQMCGEQATHYCHIAIKKALLREVPVGAIIDRRPVLALAEIPVQLAGKGAATRLFGSGVIGLSSLARRKMAASV